MATYTYDESLGSLRDHARYYIGDISAPWILPNETIDKKLSQSGWVNGMIGLVRGLLSQFGQQPKKYLEGGGATVDFSDRIPVWRKLLQDLIDGKIQDPTLEGTFGGAAFGAITAENKAAY